jgi:hypothetical protein
MKKRGSVLLIVAILIAGITTSGAKLDKSFIIKESNYKVSIAKYGQFAIYVKGHRLLSSGALMFGFYHQGASGALKKIQAQQSEAQGNKTLTIKGIFDGLRFTERFIGKSNSFDVIYDIEVIKNTPNVKKGKLRLPVLKLTMDVLKK